MMKKITHHSFLHINLIFDKILLSIDLKYKKAINFITLIDFDD